MFLKVNLVGWYKVNCKMELQSRGATWNLLIMALLGGKKGYNSRVGKGLYGRAMRGPLQGRLDRPWLSGRLVVKFSSPAPNIFTTNYFSFHLG
jgi:hypothetical protein